MKWLDFGDQRSKVTVTFACKDWGTPPGNPFKFTINVHLYLLKDDLIYRFWVTKGQTCTRPLECDISRLPWDHLFRSVIKIRLNKDGLITFWWAKVQVHNHSDLNSVLWQHISIYYQLQAILGSKTLDNMEIVMCINWISFLYSVYRSRVAGNFSTQRPPWSEWLQRFITM